MPKDKKEAFAKAANTSVGYLRLIVAGERKPSIELCKNIEQASKNAVTRFDLRPDFFEDIPELKTKTPTEAA
jgi:transcriptional regulator with XRE-family HTH domain